MAEFPSWTWSSLAGGRKPSLRKESARPVLALLLVNAERDCSRPFGLNGRASCSNRMSGYGWLAHLGEISSDDDLLRLISRPENAPLPKAKRLHLL